ncbi:2980_t:CDS:2, partial [Scutellospora calospora]
IINFRTGVRYNQHLLKLAARRMFAPIWSARRHPIYQAIEIANEEQLMRLHTILEEVNKTLKTLIPPIPTQKHWEIAARNCTKFMKQFRVQLRKAGFLNLDKNNRSFESLDGNTKLSEEIKTFSQRARTRCINYIKGKFNLINLSECTRYIPVILDEEQLQLAESSLKKEEIIFTIKTLIGSLNEANRPQFKGLKSK